MAAEVIAFRRGSARAGEAPDACRGDGLEPGDAPPPRPAAEATAEQPLRIVHLVGRMTDSVFSFLGPATEALARQGVRQTVVLTDDPLYRHLLPRIPGSVRLVLTDGKGSLSDRMRALLDAYCDVVHEDRPAIAHLHGVVCSLLGVYAARWHGATVPFFFSPHGSRLLGPHRGLGAVFLWILNPLTNAFGSRAIASSHADARLLSRMTQRSVNLLESPVGASFFQSGAVPSGYPHVVTSGRAPNLMGAAQFAQCAVVLSDQVPGLRFEWIGATDAEAAARLAAAGVAMEDLRDDAARAAKVARSWVYVAPGGALGFPVFLTEAMALGIPCVAWDTPYHRDIIEDGVNGYLCRDMRTLLARIDDLIESPALRSRIGAAAREGALARFDGTRFGDLLLGLYERSASASPAGTSRTPTLVAANGLPVGLTATAHPGASPLRMLLARMALRVLALLAVTSPSRGGRHKDDRRLAVVQLSAAKSAATVGSLDGIGPDVLEHLLAQVASGTASVAVASRDERVIGHAQVEWSGPRSTAVGEAFPPCPEIHSVTVDAGERSNGVGSRLVASCERSARERGHRLVSATVTAENVQAYALFRRLGYVEAPELAQAAQADLPARARDRVLIKSLA